MVKMFRIGQSAAKLPKWKKVQRLNGVGENITTFFLRYSPAFSEN